jgi:hypothetical protein
LTFSTLIVGNKATLNIYKKGPINEGKSFRTITLTASLSKIFASFLHIQTMGHMIRNNYLASSQKGFLPEVSGCIEYHFTMKELIKGKYQGKQIFRFHSNRHKKCL